MKFAVLIDMYLPMIGASSRFVCAGTCSGRVMIAVASASLHAQVRAHRKSGSTALGDRLLRGLRVLRQVRDDHLDGHRVVVRMPAVVVGDERQRRVADLRLARELGLLQVRHADDVHAPRAIQLRLGQRRELRPFHVHVGAAAVDRRARLPAPSRRRSPTASPQNGCANATCATSPRPKNVLMRPFVRSKN